MTCGAEGIDRDASFSTIGATPGLPLDGSRKIMGGANLGRRSPKGNPGRSTLTITARGADCVGGQAADLSLAAYHGER